uniref:Uncharacterized protein n=1 Tax=Pithovirus LCDPAC01 TaxID=2506600 RepID=A0A481YPB5_9VIRU|nr:MAG: hypothetical protein LCDPAC01_01230 [Pithovirus LCDPAC01]
MAFLICRNIENLVVVYRDSIRGVDKKHQKNYPNPMMLNLSSSLLSSCYPKNMFTDDGFTYDSKKILTFGNNGRLSLLIYSKMKREFTPEMAKKINSRDSDHLCKTFEAIFKRVPFNTCISKFKNLFESRDMTEENREEIWEYLQMLSDLMVNEETHIERHMK